MIKEILEGKDSSDELFKQAMADIKDINKMLDKAIKEKDLKKLDIIGKALKDIKY